MAKMLKFAILGGAVGAAIVVAKKSQSQDAGTEAAESSTLKVAGGSALAGAAVGFMLDRRTRRRSRVSVSASLRAGNLADAARAAKPVIEHALEVARPKVEHAAEATRDAAASAVEAARPRVEEAARAARARIAA